MGSSWRSHLVAFSALAVLIAAGSSAPVASAATHRYASPTGSGDCTSVNPCSITQAVQGANTGDEVILSPGDYPLSATLEAPHQITIHGIAGQPRPRLQFSGSNQLGLWLRWASTLRYVEVDQAAAGTGQMALIAFDGSKVDQVVAKAPDTAMDVRNNSTVRDSIAVASATNGRALVAGAIGSYTITNTFRNVTAIATGSGGVAIDAFSWTLSHVTVNLVNSIARGGPGGYSLRASTDSTGATATINVGHSNWSGFSVAGTNAAVNDGGGKQIAVPAFVNAAAGDYRQAPGSPTIDAGLYDPSSDAYDVDGDPRVIGATDLGADEFVVPPVATTGAASAVTLQSATLAGSVDAKGAPTSYHFEYGPTTGYGSTTPSTAAGSSSGAAPAGATLDGLSPATTYHYRLVATNAGGTAKGGDQTFTTASPPPGSTPPASGESPTTQTAGAVPAFGGVKLVSTRLTFRSKFIRLKLSCPAGTVGRCAGRTKLTARRPGRVGAASAVTLGRASFSIAAGTQASVRVRVTRAGRRLLSRSRRLRGRDTNAAWDGAGRSKTTVAAVTIRRRHR
jgi:hypothetical protein